MHRDGTRAYSQACAHCIAYRVKALKMPAGRRLLARHAGCASLHGLQLVSQLLGARQGFQLLGWLPGLLHGRHTVRLDGKLLDLLRRGALNRAATPPRDVLPSQVAEPQTASYGYGSRNAS